MEIEIVIIIGTIIIILIGKVVILVKFVVIFVVRLISSTRSVVVLEQHPIRLAQMLEFGCGILIARVLVWMSLQRALSRSERINDEPLPTCPTHVLRTCLYALLTSSNDAPCPPA